MPPLAFLRTLIAVGWFGFQMYIMLWPMDPMIQRPVHVFIAVVAAFLWQPLKKEGTGTWRCWVDAGLIVASLATLGYYLQAHDRLVTRMENVDPVLFQDMLFGLLALMVILEATRRVVGWSLLGVILGFVAYGFLGPWFPGWMRFQGFNPELYIEILTMAGHGILGVTTETSVTFVYYFIAFAAVYSATGGGELFIDFALRVTGRQKGGAAKAEVISSALFGTISGSAVANVVATGIFTIPLMKKTGYSPEEAAAHEATASTGGQLMPPVMGIAAFVMAELLQVPYARIALAGVIPAVAYYFALYVIVDLRARHKGMGSISAEELARTPPVLPRIHLFLPPVALVVLLIVGYSATYAALVSTGVALAAGFLRKETRPNWKKIGEMVDETAKQAAQVAIPIIAIGIIIAVAIQSNLALKFSTQLIQISGGTLLASMLFIILGCIIMGMGLPTVAAYIIGAVLFVPALRKLGIPELASHMFVMYYCVLSMITPPVALASYTAAGIAGANSWKTGWFAFRLSLVLFLIPFAFAFDDSLLWSGPLLWILFAFGSMLLATFAWAVFLEGYLYGRISQPERWLFCAASLAIIFAPTGTFWWGVGSVAAAALTTWCFTVRAQVLGGTSPVRS
jgi:TRAP transporter 4TM/12TM fusion protein